MSADADILQREKGFWEGSAEYYDLWLARDVLMVFPPPAGTLNREEVLAGIRSGPRWASVEIADTAVARVGSSVVALAYRARARKSDSESDYSALVGSVYVREGDEWKLAFHQHTPIGEPTKD